jgi:polyhydroxyalkanoate synthesis regulator phasin
MEKKKKKEEMFIEKFLDYGIGGLTFLKEKISKLADEMEKKGKKEKAKAKEIPGEIKEKIEGLSETTKAILKKLLKNTGIATKDDLDKLKEEIIKKEKEAKK